ncbi:uncharacterized protein LOC122004876 [Zingiber officinale]|uniref:uncharacterized protein LOC122004876 n=1 Tax=Zingiber officinale TaxID=94328 RepID=UPI001C4BEB88|nr:uncharacterized protein LOC122004876 [Zingiber officinale]
MLPAPLEECSSLPLYNGLAVKFLDDDDDHLKCKYQLVYLLPISSTVSSTLYQLCLYDSAAGAWIVDDRQVDLGSPSLNLKNLVLFEGSVFVSSSSASRVAAIDTSTRLVNFLPAPDSVSQGDEINVAVWEEAGNRPWLCLVHYDRRSCKFTLWRWSNGSIWVKFNEVVVDRRRHGKAIKYFILQDGGAMNGMLLIFDGHSSSFAYSFKWQQFTKLSTKMRESYSRFITYTNSLRPC